jgi:hypothetical protein
LFRSNAYPAPRLGPLAVTRTTCGRPDRMLAAPGRRGKTAFGRQAGGGPDIGRLRRLRLHQMVYDAPPDCDHDAPALRGDAAPPPARAERARRCPCAATFYQAFRLTWRPWRNMITKIGRMDRGRAD